MSAELDVPVRRMAVITWIWFALRKLPPTPVRCCLHNSKRRPQGSWPSGQGPLPGSVNVAAMAMRRAVLLAASACDLAAGAIIAWWAVSGAYALGPFALLFVAASVLLIAQLYKNSLRLLVIALGSTLFAELEPLGGVTASALLRAPIPWLGSVLPLGAGALSIAGMVAVLVLWHPTSEKGTP